MPVDEWAEDLLVQFVRAELAAFLLLGTVIRLA
jgi:hypothetical protein